MKHLTNEISSWYGSLAQSISSKGYRNVEELRRDKDKFHTHLVWKAIFNKQDVILKLPNPIHLKKFLNVHDRETFIVTYWRWVHRSTFHHLAVSKLGSGLVPLSPEKKKIRASIPPVEWVPGFGFLYEVKPEVFEMVAGHLGEEQMNRQKPLFPMIVQFPLMGAPLRPQVFRSAGFFRRSEKTYESVEDFGRRLSSAIEALSARGIELLDLDPAHLIQRPDGQIGFLGMSHTVFPKWRAHEDLYFGGGVTDGAEDLIAGEWHHHRPKRNWQDYLPRIGVFLQGVAEDISDEITRNTYKEKGRKLQNMAKHDLKEGSLAEFWEDFVGRQKTGIIRHRTMRLGHFVDVENCRWSVLGMLIDMGALVKVVENKIGRALEVVPHSHGNRWAAIPNRPRNADLDWWDRAFLKADFQKLIPSGESKTKDESDDHVLVEKLLEAGPQADGIVLYTSEGRKFSDGIRDLLQSYSHLRVWLLGFGQLNHAWQSLAEQFANRFKIMDSMKDYQIMNCIKGEF